MAVYSPLCHLDTRYLTESIVHATSLINYIDNAHEDEVWYASNKLVMTLIVEVDKSREEALNSYEAGNVFKNLFANRF